MESRNRGIGFYLLIIAMFVCLSFVWKGMWTEKQSYMTYADFLNELENTGNIGKIVRCRA